MTSSSTKQYELIKRAYDRFVPRQLMRLTGKQDITQVEPGDHTEQKMTVLFSDIRNFTMFSESLTPEENFNFLNSYLSQVSPLLSTHNGIIDKYVGDAIMALFNGQADDAVQGSFELLNWLEEYNRGRGRAGYKPISIGIGLNTGILMLGTVGSAERMDYTVIGESVNIASRIEALTKEFGVQLIISEHTYRSLVNPARYLIRFLDRLAPRGSEQPISLYEVFDGNPPGFRKKKKNHVHLFEDAVAHFHYKKIWKAEQLLKRYLNTLPEDIAARVYLNRCKLFRTTGVHRAAKELTIKPRWRNEYLIGIATIDNQHRRLFNYALKVSNAVHGKNDLRFIIECITFLKEYARTHFSDEEAFLVSIGYPHIENQRQQHASFLRDLTLLARNIELYTSTSTRYTLFRIHILVVGWIIQHILGEDLHYAKYFRHQNADT